MAKYFGVEVKIRLSLTIVQILWNAQLASLFICYCSKVCAVDAISSLHICQSFNLHLVQRITKQKYIKDSFEIIKIM